LLLLQLLSSGLWGLQGAAALCRSLILQTVQGVVGGAIDAGLCVVVVGGGILVQGSAGFEACRMSWFGVGQGHAGLVEEGGLKWVGRQITRGRQCAALGEGVVGEGSTCPQGC
jgi:hypothetical protein